LDTADPIRQKKILDEIQVYLAENYYVIPMFARGNIIGSTSRFQFGPAGAFGDMYWNAETWDVQ
jgi:ABC-type transport system substrate-binding protein